MKTPVHDTVVLLNTRLWSQTQFRTNHFQSVSTDTDGGGGGNMRAETFLMNQLRRKHLESGQHFVFIFFLFSTFTICISTDLFFFVSSHFVFLVLISQFVSDVLPSLLHTFSLFLIFHRFVQINDVPQEKKVSFFLFYEQQLRRNPRSTHSNSFDINKSEFTLLALLYYMMSSFWSSTRVPIFHLCCLLQKSSPLLFFRSICFQLGRESYSSLFISKMA